MGVPPMHSESMGGTPMPLKTMTSNNHASRREFLWRFGGGLGGVAMAHLLGMEGLLADVALKPNPALNGGVHHHAKVKRVVQLFMNGGASQIDLFDYKPQLIKLHGQ